MRILLVYPRYPDTFWSFRHALKFIAKKAAYPPLGLLTVASLLPPQWEKKVVDLNADELHDEDIAWADYVFISAMDVQRGSAHDVVRRCRELGTKVVAGGPLFTTGHEEFPDVDYFVLGEGEDLVPRLVADLEMGGGNRFYQSNEKPDVRKSPIPAWELIDTRKYASLSIQYSRGCPFDCEFCDIVLLNGRVPRTKDVTQLIGELEAIYRLGTCNTVFIVDDNFIGNKKKLKAEVLPAVIDWMKRRDYPFTLFTQASIGIADDEELIRMMIDAGFDRVFIGIETPNEESLGECGKHQNTRRDLMACVRKLQNRGLEVQGGFIVGFDSDPSNIFERQISFIQQSGIVTAMVGLLNAPRGTKLYKRLKDENRLIRDASGDNTDFSINFIPRMSRESLVGGYKNVLTSIYSPRNYYARIRTFLREHRPVARRRRSLRRSHIEALVKSFWYLGVVEGGRMYYWRLVTSTLLRRPRSFPLAITLAVYGYHYRKLLDGYARGGRN
ncbi:MAG: B12-binding domain-containing radical SAM protein [Dehalococcoidia bacterium]|nr:B12-binding domain-containing radical SAM protein [Dehalococcoidia bacterium]